ncbi:hypothetical protein B0I37DRAFT_400458 [Chaetomium sp. MPI-CAGE-AT-0009]|nr:hypothetical protein B0I37DRAFT_400458 [Chaetomium sp. MPI-CAGE-AT-0009]
MTLAAASSTDCTGGLFFDAKTIDISAPEASESNIPYELFACKKMKHFQPNFAPMKRDEAKDEYHKLLEPTELLPTRAELAGFWYEFISTYSQAALSYQTDRWAAVEGIVQYMRPLRNSESLAGLWADTFTLDLLWRGHPSQIRTAGGLFEVPRSTSFPLGLGKVRRNDEGKKIFYFPDFVEEEALGGDAEVHCLCVMVEQDDHWSLLLRRRDGARNVYERLEVVGYPLDVSLNTDV